MAFDPIFVFGNYVEAGLWATMGAIALWKRPNRWAVLLGATLVAFGASDLVEAGTGAWYRPWWLLAWKTAGVLGIVILGALAWDRVRATRSPPTPTPVGSDRDSVEAQAEPGPTRTGASDA